ncbi:alkaline phosphatase family protein [Belliella marina]|uniref:Alkaline phosphatase family protein n=1 Tax=Belliella marina TaxID=1644146 RepID=A0ABW4VTJ1_9BACT
MKQHIIFLFVLFSVGSSIDLYAQNRQKKVLFVILDGIPAEVIENNPTPNLDKISEKGGYSRAYVGGVKGGHSETPTISAVGYNSLLTGTWVNKHNVRGNSIRQPNYNYWSIFRFFKEAYPCKKTAIYSTWQDNRTKLLGENLPETGFLGLDFHFDGLELDTIAFTHDPLSSYIRDIDSIVSKKAANDISVYGPDLTWVYLQYTDDVGHRYGFGDEMDKATREADHQIGLLWQSIQKRIQYDNEDWLIIITTDHGRGEGGFHHGGQSDEEREIWIASNYKFNVHFDNNPGIVDVLPTIAEYLAIPIAKNKAMELDGVSMLGEVYASDLRGSIVDEKLKLTWKGYQNQQNAIVWLTSSNQFRHGNTDHYHYLGEVEIGKGSAEFDLESYEFENLKVVLELPKGFINTWVKKVEVKNEIESGK